MIWTLGQHGFLPNQDPLPTLVSHKDKYIPLLARLENITHMMPSWLDERRFREEVVYQLREVTYCVDEEFFNSWDEAGNERLMKLYSYLASSYVYARHETPATRIPIEIAVPLCHFAEKVGRPPILSYASYCLNNWMRMDPSGPIKLGNIELLTNFCSPSSGKTDEDWFILVHVDIEKEAQLGVDACNQYLVYKEVLDPDLAKLLTGNIARSLRAMNVTLARMPEQCSEDNYFRWVRPYIFGFNNVVYEGCFENNPQTYRGETGAQSSIIPAFLAALGVQHKDSMLTHHLKVMRQYMPPQHRAFLSNLDAAAAKNNLRTVAANCGQEHKDVYNDALEQLIAFRDKHLEYAHNYIAKKVERPEGTGGTPYVPWLKQLRDETVEHLFR